MTDTTAEGAVSSVSVSVDVVEMENTPPGLSLAAIVTSKPPYKGKTISII